MARPALILALLAVLLTAPAAFAKSREDFEKLPTTMDPTGCPMGDQSARQPWYAREDAYRVNETGCQPGETISECYRRQYDIK